MPGSEWFDTKMSVHTSTKKTDVSLALDFQKDVSNESRKHSIIDNVKQKKGQVKKIGKTNSII